MNTSNWKTLFIAAFVVVVIFGFITIQAEVRNNTSALKNLAPYKYVDARIEERIRFFLDYLQYDLPDGYTMPTNYVVKEILKYLELDVLYVSQTETLAGVELRCLPGDEVK